MEPFTTARLFPHRLHGRNDTSNITNKTDLLFLKYTFDNQILKYLY